MADTIQLRAGNKENMPVLRDREPAYVRDENALYVGTPEGNKKVGADVDLTGYATEEWVEGKGYLTEHQDLSGYAKKSEVPTKTSQLTNDSGFLTSEVVGATYSGAWIATDTSGGTGQQYTETISIPAGTYIVIVSTPYAGASDPNAVGKIMIQLSVPSIINSNAKYTIMNSQYGFLAVPIKVSAQTNLFVASAATNNSATWSDLECGGIAAIRIA